MNKRFFIAFLIALPFLWLGSWTVGAWVAAQKPPALVNPVQNLPAWVNPNQNPPDGNLPGPVWLLPSASTDQQTGKINISGAGAFGSYGTFGSYILATAGSFSSPTAYNSEATVSAIQTVAAKKAVYAVASNSASYAVYGLATNATSWAGYFNERVFAKKYCLGDPVAPDCIDSWGQGGIGSDTFWNRQGATKNIFKAKIDNSLDGIVAIGTDTPSTTFPFTDQVKLGIFGNSPRIYLDGNTAAGAPAGNPEIDFKLSSSANDHWAIYADENTRNFVWWSKETASATAGANKLALTPQGVMVFYGWQAQGGVLKVTISGTGSGTVKSDPSGINCSSGTCERVFALGTSVTLTAAPATGSVFAGWSGSGCSNASTTCTVIIAANTPVSATFMIPDTPTVTTGTAPESTRANVPKYSIKLHGSFNVKYTVLSSTNASSAFFLYYNNSPSTCGSTGSNVVIPAFSFVDSHVAGDRSKDYDYSIVVGDNEASSLKPDTTYYYCAVLRYLTADNSIKTVYGAVQSFTTNNLTQPATNVSNNSATLNGLAYNNTLSGAQGWFRYSGSNPGACNDTFGTRAPGSGGTNLDTTTTSQSYNQTISGLNAVTTYYYCAIAENSVGKAYGSVLQFTTTSTSTAPTVSSPTATSIASTTATLGANITSNGGASITARGTCWGTGGAPTSNCAPEGGTATGVFTQARTDLTAGTKLFYRGYATNSVGTGYSSDGSFFTEPANQASNITFPSVGINTMTVNWTRGSGDGVIVLMKSGSAVNSDPQDGTYTYTANAAFASGTQIGTGNYVVYRGTGTSVAVTALTGSTTYYVAVYEYKGDVNTSGADQGTNYKTPAVTGNRTTANDTIAPSIPSLTATVVSSSQINLNWTASTDNVAVTGYKIERCQGAGCTNFSQIAIITSGTSYNSTGLTASTSYSYRVRAYDAAGNHSEYSNTASATTLAAPTYTLTVKKYDTMTYEFISAGLVTSSPSGIDCGSVCAYNFSGTVTLTANNTRGYSFQDWSNCDSPSGNICYMNMTTNKEVTANYQSNF